MLKNQNVLFVIFLITALTILTGWGILFESNRQQATPTVPAAPAMAVLLENILSSEKFEENFAQATKQTLPELIDKPLQSNFAALKQYFPTKFSAWQNLIETEQIHLGFSSEVTQLGLFVLPCTNHGQAEILLSPQIKVYDQAYITAVLYHEIIHAEDVYHSPAPQEICQCTTKLEFEAEKKTQLFLKRLNYAEKHPENQPPSLFDAAGNFDDQKLAQLVFYRYPDCHNNLTKFAAPK